MLSKVMKFIAKFPRFLYRNATVIISCIFIIVFAYAANHKLKHYDKSVLEMGKSPLLTGNQHILGWLLPATEYAIALLLALNRTRRMGLYASLALMVMFTAYIIIITNFADHVPCSCGGVIDDLTWTEHLYFNFGLIALATTGIAIQGKQQDKSKRENYLKSEDGTREYFL